MIDISSNESFIASVIGDVFLNVDNDLQKKPQESQAFFQQWLQLELARKAASLCEIDKFYGWRFNDKDAAENFAASLKLFNLLSFETEEWTWKIETDKAKHFVTLGLVPKTQAKLNGNDTYRAAQIIQGLPVLLKPLQPEAETVSEFKEPLTTLSEALDDAKFITKAKSKIIAGLCDLTGGSSFLSELSKIAPAINHPSNYCGGWQFNNAAEAEAFATFLAKFKMVKFENLQWLIDTDPHTHFVTLGLVSPTQKMLMPADTHKAMQIVMGLSALYKDDIDADIAIVGCDDKPLSVAALTSTPVATTNLPSAMTQPIATSATIGTDVAADPSATTAVAPNASLLALLKGAAVGTSKVIIEDAALSQTAKKVSKPRHNGKKTSAATRDHEDGERPTNRAAQTTRSGRSFGAALATPVNRKRSHPSKAAANSTTETIVSIAKRTRASASIISPSDDLVRASIAATDHAGIRTKRVLHSHSTVSNLETKSSDEKTLTDDRSPQHPHIHTTRVSSKSPIIAVLKSAAAAASSAHADLDDHLDLLSEAATTLMNKPASPAVASKDLLSSLPPPAHLPTATKTTPTDESTTALASLAPLSSEFWESLPEFLPEISKSSASSLPLSPHCLIVSSADEFADGEAFFNGHDPETESRKRSHATATEGDDPKADQPSEKRARVDTSTTSTDVLVKESQDSAVLSSPTEPTSAASTATTTEAFSVVTVTMPLIACTTAPAGKETKENSSDLKRTLPTTKNKVGGDSHQHNIISRFAKLVPLRSWKIRELFMGGGAAKKTATEEGTLLTCYRDSHVYHKYWINWQSLVEYLMLEEKDFKNALDNRTLTPPILMFLTDGRGGREVVEAIKLLEFLKTLLPKQEPRSRTTRARADTEPTRPDPPEPQTTRLITLFDAINILKAVSESAVWLQFNLDLTAKLSKPFADKLQCYTNTGTPCRKWMSLNSLSAFLLIGTEPSTSDEMAAWLSSKLIVKEMPDEAGNKIKVVEINAELTACLRSSMSGAKSKARAELSDAHTQKNSDVIALIDAIDDYLRNDAAASIATTRHSSSPSSLTPAIARAVTSVPSPAPSKSLHEFRAHHGASKNGAAADSFVAPTLGTDTVAHDRHDAIDLILSGSDYHDLAAAATAEGEDGKVSAPSSSFGASSTWSRSPTAANGTDFVGANLASMFSLRPVSRSPMTATSANLLSTPLNEDDGCQPLPVPLGKLFT